MTISRNPFLERTSERLDEQPRFVHTFAANAVSALPDDPWRTLVVLRSSPGAGKTSLMRLFDAETLTWVARHRVDPLRERLVRLEALSPDGREALRLGVLIDLRTGYKAVLDSSDDPEEREGLFRRLLDARVLGATIRSALRLRGLRFPADAPRFRLRPFDSSPELEAIVSRLGGLSGEALLTTATEIERLVLEHVDGTTPNRAAPGSSGHSRFLALDALDRSEILIDATPLRATPLLMFDDGHDLPPVLRRLLLDELQRRFSRIGRWYSERHSALDPEELIGEGSNIDRDVQVIDLDSLARSKRSRHSTTLREMAHLRAAEALRVEAQEHRSFFELLSDTPVELEPFEGAATVMSQEVAELTAGKARYTDASASAREQPGPLAVERLATLLVAVNRDLDRQQSLFPETMTPDEAALSPSIREGARTRAAARFKLPYYAGSERIVKLSSGNADQFMMVCGAMFSEIAVSIGVGRDPTISFERQHKLVKMVARHYWDSIPKTIPHGRRIHKFVSGLVGMAKGEDAKPNLPYPPGVTGFSIATDDVQSLKESKRERDVLVVQVLAAAVAHNVLGLDTERMSKNQSVYVFYLNRLLCAHFDLSLGYGGHREQRPNVLRSWLGPSQEAML